MLVELLSESLLLAVTVVIHAVGVAGSLLRVEKALRQPGNFWHWTFLFVRIAVERRLSRNPPARHA